MKLFLSLLLFFLPALIRATEPSDLGNNLSYLRVHSLADATPALQSALSVKHACVLDLRYSTASDESPAALRTALAAHPPETALFILIGPATPTAITSALNSSAQGRFITLGIAGSDSAPQIVVKTTAEIDHQAYEAFEHGTSLSELISGKIEKDRYDEATLVHEFKTGTPDPDPPFSPDPTKPKNNPSAGKSSESATPSVEPLRDRVLQRAVNLHQALLALRR